MGPSVKLLVNATSVAALVPGSVIGRSPSAALRLDSPGISEAHALISLRGTSLRMLSLRGRFAVAGRRVDDVELVEGVVIELGPELTLEVLSVVLPPSVAGLHIEGLGRLVPPSVGSFRAPGLAPVAGHHFDAEAVLWGDGDGFRLRLEGYPDRRLRVGDTFVVGARRCTVVEMPLAMAAAASTTGSHAFSGPLELVVRFDTVHVRRAGVVTAIDGIPGRIVSELALIGVPAEWRAVAAEVWPKESDERKLRMSWDRGVARLRERLRATGIREDLVRFLGNGVVELFLGPDDVITDES